MAIFGIGKLGTLLCGPIVIPLFDDRFRKPNGQIPALLEGFVIF